MVSVPFAVGSPRLLVEVAALATGGPWQRGPLADRLEEVLGAATADRVAGVLVEHFRRPPWGPVDRLASELAALPALEAALSSSSTVDAGSIDPPWDGLSRARWRWPVAPWASVEDLAHGLDLDVGELAWLADPAGWLRRRPRASDGDGGRLAGRLRHYRYRWHTTGSGRARLLEAPKPLLAERQRRIARRVLAAIPVHPVAHGFVPGRSVATFAAPHAGRAVVVRVDLEGFFTAITAARVRGLFVTAGYPRPVARLLAGLLTTATPTEVLRAAPAPPTGALISARHRQRLRLATPHLPQGAPSSPAMANLIAYGLDRRLDALAASRGLVYTRYADDLAFSGPADIDTVALRRTITRIVTDEGFRPHPTKTRVMRAHRRQRLAGLVVNSEPAVPRDDYDLLRAILHNATVTGPAAQNRHDHPDFAAHLQGRIAWVAATHPRRGERLQALFDRVRWNI